MKIRTQNSKLKAQKYGKSFNSGQVVLILVLITVIGLTIGLSLISRTITDVRISSQIEQSSRAFSAAEAGIETALKGVNTLPTGSVTLENSSAQYEVTSIGGTQEVYSFPLTEANSSQTIWLASRDANGNFTTPYYPTTGALDICWGKDADNKAALILNLYYLDGSYKVAKLAFDPNAVRAVNNKFSGDFEKTPANYCSGNYQYRKSITFDSATDFGINSSSTLLALRITPVYEDTIIGILPNGAENLPVQGNQITSVGQTDTGIVRKIQVNKSYETLPSLLDFAIFCEGTCQQ